MGQTMKADSFGFALGCENLGGYVKIFSCLSPYAKSFSEEH
jgi:hypothetical protein